MVPIPSSIQVGPFRFRIETSLEHIAKARLEGRDHRIGETDTRQLVIMVDATIPVDQQRDTLFHEVQHAVWYVIGGYHKDESENDEERYVGRMTSILLDTLRRNPDLERFLFEPDEPVFSMTDEMRDQLVRNVASIAVNGSVMQVPVPDVPPGNLFRRAQERQD